MFACVDPCGKAVGADPRAGYRGAGWQAEAKSDLSWSRSVENIGISLVFSSISTWPRVTPWCGPNRPVEPVAGQRRSTRRTVDAFGAPIPIPRNMSSTASAAHSAIAIDGHRTNVTERDNPNYPNCPRLSRYVATISVPDGRCLKSGGGIVPLEHIELASLNVPDDPQTRARFAELTRPGGVELRPAEAYEARDPGGLITGEKYSDSSAVV
jgi:hypothetical protein